MTPRVETRPYAVLDHPWAEKFLARRRSWDWHGPAEIDVFDAGGVITDLLEDWRTAIFHVADGNHTLQEFISSMADQYGDPAAVPAELAQLLLAETRALVEDRQVIELWDRAADLADDFDLPRSQRHLLTPGDETAG
ncbi:MAG TPA: hypothetical protein VF557_00945 [Jatrophihabitans sp.]|jgi:hypothetical protein|uniref:hypothetical protein n=1 Tax=Jatrophihabitans sp. TaxID=1932789 RepID=UPI002F123A93